jgi:hypothetical protein
MAHIGNDINTIPNFAYYSFHNILLKTRKNTSTLAHIQNHEGKNYNQPSPPLKGKISRNK